MFISTFVSQSDCIICLFEFLIAMETIFPKFWNEILLDVG